MVTNRVCVIAHIDYENAGFISEWAHERNVTLFERRIYHGDALPSLEEFDALIILGGPQSVTEYQNYPFLVQEIDFIRKVIHSLEHRVLGICLGFQMLAVIHSLEVIKSPYSEIGFFNLTFSENHSDPFISPILKELLKETNSLAVCHWHEEMVDTKNKFTVLASSSGCPTQIVRFSERVYGFQCHFEFTPEIVKNIILNENFDPPEDNSEKYIQSKERILEAPNFEVPRQFLFHFLDSFLLPQP
jgi:GMP synthase (glutamine-hydrolysing)